MRRKAISAHLQSKGAIQATIAKKMLSRHVPSALHGNEGVPAERAMAATEREAVRLNSELNRHFHIPVWKRVIKHRIISSVMIDVHL